MVQTHVVLESLAQSDKMGGELMENTVRSAEGFARRLAFELDGVTLHELFFEQYLQGMRVIFVLHLWEHAYQGDLPG